jgi:hypothetical protein
VRAGFAGLVVLALVVCPVAFGEPAAGIRSAGDGWAVQVSVEPTDLGPIVVSVGSRRVSGFGSHVWLQHDLVYENTGDRTVTFADTRAAAVLGPAGRPMLVASDEGCAYYRVRPLRGACLLNLDFPTVKPHRTISRTVTLWRGLRGMKPLRAGTFVFRKPLRFQVGRSAPDVGTGRSVAIKLVYKITVR